MSPPLVAAGWLQQRAALGGAWPHAMAARHVFPGALCVWPRVCRGPTPMTTGEWLQAKTRSTMPPGYSALHMGQRSRQPINTKHSVPAGQAGRRRGERGSGAIHHLFRPRVNDGGVWEQYLSEHFLWLTVQHLDVLAPEPAAAPMGSGRHLGPIGPRRAPLAKCICILARSLGITGSYC